MKSPEGSRGAWRTWLEFGEHRWGEARRCSYSSAVGPRLLSSYGCQGSEMSSWTSRSWWPRCHLFLLVLEELHLCELSVLVQLVPLLLFLKKKWGARTFGNFCDHLDIVFVLLPFYEFLQADRAISVSVYSIKHLQEGCYSEELNIRNTKNFFGAFSNSRTVSTKRQLNGQHKQSQLDFDEMRLTFIIKMSRQIPY